METEKLQQAIMLVKSGDKKSGQNLLIDLVNSDPQNETAWLWLASVVSQDKRVFCLEKVVSINPNNVQAKQYLEKFRANEQIQSNLKPQSSVANVASVPKFTNQPIPNTTQNFSPVIVKIHWITKVFAVACFIFFAFCTFMSYRAHAPMGVVVTFLLFTAGGGYFWLATNSSIELDGEEIAVSAPQGRYRIGWREVNLIQTNGMVFAFNGQNKRVVINLSRFSLTARKVINLIFEQSKQRNIKIQNTNNIPLTQLNSKV